METPGNVLTGLHTIHGVFVCLFREKYIIGVLCYRDGWGRHTQINLSTFSHFLATGSTVLHRWIKILLKRTKFILQPNNGTDLPF